MWGGYCLAPFHIQGIQGIQAHRRRHAVESPSLNCSGKSAAPEGRTKTGCLEVKSCHPQKWKRIPGYWVNKRWIKYIRIYIYIYIYIYMYTLYIYIPNASKDYCLNGRCDKGYFLGKDDYLYDFHCTLKSTLFYLRLSRFHRCLTDWFSLGSHNMLINTWVQICKHPGTHRHSKDTQKSKNIIWRIAE